MTLIIGVLCSDGIVVGADGAATLGTLGQQTVLQPVKKLTVVANTAIMGVSGSVGLAQRIGGNINKLWDDRKLRGASFEVMQAIRDGIGPMLLNEINSASQAAKLIGHQAASPAALSFTLLAIPVQGQPRLYQFGCTGDPEEATVDLPFVALGSGQNLADPFLAFLRSLFLEGSISEHVGRYIRHRVEPYACDSTKHRWRSRTDTTDDFVEECSRICRQRARRS